MGTWHFYLGLKDEWRWYRVDRRGTVLDESDRGFAELHACMANAECAGFTGQVFRVHTRSPISPRALGDSDTPLIDPPKTEHRSEEHALR
jgi:hypothetical protein